jgi:hypothetical protein
MGLLPSLQFRDVFMVNISAGCEMGTFPVVKGVVGDQAVNTNDRTDKEGLALLETFNCIDPCIIDIC